jgi:hypothetical protein
MMSTDVINAPREYWFAIAIWAGAALGGFGASGMEPRGTRFGGTLVKTTR